jgi:alanine-glyoxylate transaminase/serine-glyoxylate transaminase/serine-pyruvate transaminase
MSGRPFLQVPGPTNVPERVLRAMDRAVPDHRGSTMPALVGEIVERIRPVFGTEQAAIVPYPGSGTAAWEASLANTLNPGDRVLAFDNGHFSHSYAECARKLGLAVDEIDVEWGYGIPLDVLESTLAADTAGGIRAVLAVHNETSTGVTSQLAEIRAVIDRVGHRALLLVDAVSSLASIDFQFDNWAVDVALTGSQKGLMLPPGLAVLAVSERALAASRQARTPRYFLDWTPILESMSSGYFPYTPATLLLCGLREALTMLHEEGLENVFARHARHAEAVRAGVAAWGMERLCRDPAELSNTATAVLVPDDADANDVLLAAEELGLSLGAGLSRLKGRVFRLGHLGSLNELEVAAMLAGTELALGRVGLPITLGAGVSAALNRYATGSTLAATP